MAAPTVTTGVASSITPWQAALAGTIDALGGANASVWGFEITPNADKSGSWTIKTTEAVSSVPKAMAMTAQGLLEDTLYYFRAYATNGDGTGSGSWATFTTLPGGSIRNYSVTLYRRGTAGTITYTPGANSKVMNYKIEWDENRPMRANIWVDNSDVTATVNLLNSSCTQWSGSVTGALQQGDFLEFKLLRPNGSTYDTLFYGKITDLDPAGGTLLIVAYCGLKSLDKVDHGRIIYANRRYPGYFDIEISNGRRRMKSVTDNNIVLERAAIALTDIRLDLDNGAAEYTYDLGDETHYVAQIFIPSGNALVGVVFNYDTTNYSKAGSTAKVICELRLANADGTKSDTVVATCETNVGANDGKTKVECDFCAAGVPTEFVPGINYYIVIRPNITPDSAGYIGIYVNGAATKLGCDVVSDTYTGWAGAQIAGQIDMTNYEELDIEECSIDETNNYLYFQYDESDIVTVDSYYTVYRGRACYFYNTVTAETIINALIERSGLLDAAASTNMDKTRTVFDPRGKNQLDSIREILDEYEATGAPWEGYQKTIGACLVSNIWTATCGKRLKTSDTAHQILSHPDDTANDWERFIIGNPSLKKTASARFASVRVTGKDYFGNPLITTVSDKAASGSLAEALPEGFSMVQEVKADFPLQRLDALAHATLESITRGSWEGGMTLRGHHILWDLDQTSSTYASGRIMTLNWSPLGISATKFKVKSCVIHPSITEIYINNPDTLMDRIASQFIGLRDKVAQDDNDDAIYLSTFVSSVESASAGYMELQDSSGNPLSEQMRIECYVWSSPTQNFKIFSAVIPSWNAVGTIEQVEIFDAVTGGTSIVAQDLYRTASSITIDERQDKVRGKRAIIEVMVKAT